jgi:hypothetical protein
MRPLSHAASAKECAAEHTCAAKARRNFAPGKIPHTKNPSEIDPQNSAKMGVQRFKKNIHTKDVILEKPYPIFEAPISRDRWGPMIKQAKRTALYVRVSTRPSNAREPDPRAQPDC